MKQEWINNINERELYRAAPTLELETSSAQNLDDIVANMDKGIGTISIDLPDASATGGASNTHTVKDWWQQVKKEFHLFACTDDPKYKKLREKLEKATDSVLDDIALAIAAVLNITAAAIIALVAVCLYGILKLGAESYCSLQAQ